MKLLILLGTIAVTLGVSAAQSCTDYTGDQCTSVFSTANVFVPVGNSITTLDNTVNNFLAGIRLASAFTTISESCQNYLRITQCLSVYTPCNGTAWCGSMTPDDLTAAINSACDCSATAGTTCTFGPPPPIRNYYQGSSSTGRVGSAMLTCQDVTLGNAAGTMKISMMGAGLVAIFLSIGLLL